MFFSNVVAGAAGLGVFLSDVGEMLTLFAACVSFVIAILVYERSATGTPNESTTEDTEGGGTIP